MTEARRIWFEDYAPGLEIVTRVRTLFESEITRYVELCWNRTEVHTVSVADEGAEFSRIIAPSTATVGFGLGLLYWDAGYGVEEAWCEGWTGLKFPRPLYVGDTYRARLRVLECDAEGSEDHPGTGRVVAEVAVIGLDDDRPYLTGTRTSRIRRGRADGG